MKICNRNVDWAFRCDKNPTSHVKWDLFRDLYSLRDMVNLYRMRGPHVRLESLQIPVWIERCLVIYSLFNGSLFKDACGRLRDLHCRMRAPQGPVWSNEISSVIHVVDWQLFKCLYLMGSLKRGSEHCIKIYCMFTQNRNSLEPYVSRGPVWRMSSSKTWVTGWCPVTQEGPPQDNSHAPSVYKWELRHWWMV